MYITIKEEHGRFCAGQLTRIFADHGAEVIGDDFNLDIVAFSRAIDNNSIRFFVARDANDKPVGYTCFFISSDLMRAHIKTADCAAIYIMPKYRGRTSIRLMRFAEISLIAEGVKHIAVHCKPDSTLQRIYEKMGYAQWDMQLRKVI